MHFKQTSLLVSAVVLVTIGTAFCDSGAVLRFNPRNDGIGYATNCGQNPFNFSWSPKILSAQHSVDITFEYTFAYKLDGGFYNLTLREFGEAEPFLSHAYPFSCDDITKTVACPVSKGFSVNLKKTITNTKYLLSFPGRYILIVEIKNSERQQMLCARMDITINNNIY
ncbi:hypothetical protein EGW08_004964 [Elysia chlorotica]|uniref:MD-2-related lipid-recognition domain-containing protein n=1 Tax=Elysia chlorotica TaxID=188477 RepID=A0A3S1HW44_ELYCH|nr:hypothetical protein EGW08_004964 [Elysia chlorotica]